MENHPNSDAEDAEFPLQYLVTWNGAPVPLSIEPEESGQVSLVQREALRLALAMPPDILELSAPAVVQNYEVYREAIGDEEMPPLAQPVDVWKAVQPTEVIIPIHDGWPIPTFLLYAECDWDPEHGLEVRFRNGIADESNQQGEIGLED